MSADIVATSACAGIGTIAALYLSVPGFLLFAASPTLIALTCAVMARDEMSVWTLPIGWILQQVCYVAMLHYGRPAVYQSLISRVRLMMRNG